MTEPLIIVGAGGFGREVHDIVVELNQAAGTPEWDFVGFLDDGSVRLDRLERRGARLLGTTNELAQYSGARYVIGIADPKMRETLAGRADAAGLQAATLIHPTVTIGLDVQIGAGSVLCSHVSITTNIRIGHHVHLNLNSTVGHDAVLEDFVSVFPGSTISGDVVLKRGVTIGTNAAVIQGTTVNNDAFIGAGAVVVRDVMAGVTAVGVPARALGGSV